MNQVHDTASASDQKDGGLEHGNLNFLGPNTEMYFAIISGTGWALGLFGELSGQFSAGIQLIFYGIALLFGGFFTLIEAVGAIRRGKFEIDFLMLVAAAGAVVLGEYQEGALLLFLFSLGHALEHFAMERARKSISALSDLTPPTALRFPNGDLKADPIEVGIESLLLNDVILIKPNTKIAADGVVVSGVSSVNQAAITGESIPVEKSPLPDAAVTSDLSKVAAEHRTFAGTINGNAPLHIRVLRLASDSTVAKLVTMVQEAEAQKSPTQHLTDKFERYFVPAVLVLVFLLLFAFLVLDETFKESFYRAMAVLVASSPCALAISTPAAVLAGVARAAQKGVLIKGGKPLEDLGALKAIAFDKTGTLTEGKPQLTAVITAPGIEEKTLLEVAIAVEKTSDHPLAAAIVAGGLTRLGVEAAAIATATNLKALTARGVKATVDGQIAHLGNRRLFRELTQSEPPEHLQEEMSRLEAAGQTAMLVHLNDRYLGIIGVMDVARAEAKSTLSALAALGIEKMIMLTGDHQGVANAIAKEIGITDPLGSLLPQDKVNVIKQLIATEGRVAMVGDGVNDAPAMANSTVGIAMGAAGSDVALETADVALMADRLDTLPFAIGLSRMARRIIKQNLWISLGMVAILIPLTMLGIAELGPAVIAHEGSTLVVVLNALRLLRYDR